MASALQQAIALHEQGRLDEACAIYESILKDSPADFDCLHLLGIAASQRGDHDAAAELMGRALEVQPRHALCHSNRGLAFKAAGKLPEALAEFGESLMLDATRADVWSAHGIVLYELHRTEAAVASFDRALELHPPFVEVLYNRGNALQALEMFDEAIESYSRALEVNAAIATIWFNMALALRSAKRFDEAVEAFEKALSLAPDHEFLPGILLLTRMDQCDWADFDAQVARIREGLERGEKVVHPFALLALIDSPPLQRLAAEILVRSKYPPVQAQPWIPRQTGRIRVGYFSADFGDHPVSYLTAGVFEAHDRDAFEVTGFSLASREGKMRKRVEAGFEKFIDVSGLVDGDITALARKLEIDIAVDLGGHTQGARMGIFAGRAAPVQVSYAGYLGTLGAPYYDYLIADAVLVPPKHRRDYVEQIAYLPSYQANDSKREISGRSFSREELGVRGKGPIFCCLSNAYKITPAMFASWMRVLRAVGESSLMLHAAPEAAANLRAEARRAGIDPARLVFVERLPRSDYLARFRATDLFLDTSPYNAGTVASDALWAGLPVVALMGKSFAARMASSLLHAVGLEDLVAQSVPEYEAKAIDLGNSPAKRGAVQERLARNRLDHPLFDTVAFTRHLENAFRRMHELARA